MSYTIEVKRPGFEAKTEGNFKTQVSMLHTLAEKVYQNRLSVTYATVAAGDRVGVICTVTDMLTSESLTRLGEADAKEETIQQAFDTAFVNAVRDFLDVQITKNSEKNKENHAMQEKSTEVKQENKNPCMPDDEVLLFGNMKGKKFGEVKATPQFQHFLEQLLSAKENLSFPDKARQEQMRKLIEYAKENA